MANFVDFSFIHGVSEYLLQTCTLQHIQGVPNFLGHRATTRYCRGFKKVDGPNLYRVLVYSTPNSSR